MSEETDTIQLGGNIHLSGFSSLDGGSMIILKKILGNYAKKFSERCKDFEDLKVYMKVVHEREKSEKYEIKGQLNVGGKPHVADETDYNLFFVVDIVMKRLEGMIES